MDYPNISKSEPGEPRAWAQIVVSRKSADFGMYHFMGNMVHLLPNGPAYEVAAFRKFADVHEAEVRRIAEIPDTLRLVGIDVNKHHELQFTFTEEEA